MERYYVRRVLCLTQDDDLSGATWSMNGTLVLTWSNEWLANGFIGIAQVWDAATGEELLRLTHEQILGAMWNAVTILSAGERAT